MAKNGKKLTAARKATILRNFKEWTGGWGPSDMEQINTYIELSMDMFNPDGLVRAFLKSKIQKNAPDKLSL